MHMQSKMCFHSNNTKIWKKIQLLLIFLVASGCWSSMAQVNAVEFGKNRVQYKKFKWQYYQTKNFNVYYNQNGQELAKFVAQSAEKELPTIEAALYGVNAGDLCAL